MTLPPTTPPSSSLSSVDWRFEDIDDICEWVERYRPGGYHPVEVGDTFQDGRYKILRKLGEGSFSTVWLVVCTSKPKYAALKIISAKSSTTSTEFAILDHLSRASLHDPNAQHVTTLLDSFRHEGPNGVHQCLVMEIMAASAAELAEKLPENNPRQWGLPQRYPKVMAKKTLLHALKGLIFLHGNGVVHSDVQPGNLLFAIEAVDGIEEQQFKQDDAETIVPVKRIDGKADRWAPPNLYLRESLHEHVKLGADLCVKLSDFGAAFFFSDPPPRPTTPRGLRAPETILKRPFNSSIDIWSFGCLMYEFLTSEQLFTVMPSSVNEDCEDDDHFVQLNDKIGRLPDDIMEEWNGAGKWYGPDHEQLCPLGEYEPYESLEVRFLKVKNTDIGMDEADVICRLIRSILVYDPAQRPSAVELLQHPWFSEVSEGTE